ncbi:DUF3137 domain-containing protein [Chitinophaga sp. Hz27]|uniref:DUF3137 domain-containing protein n=1 Tax=Chitinophaga sp. Hz27 TaxID=3347169 RepID=UPI0035E2B7C7
MQFNDKYFEPIYQRLLPDLKELERQRQMLQGRRKWLWPAGIILLALFVVFVIIPLHLEETNVPDYQQRVGYLIIGLLLALGGGMLIRNLLLRQFVLIPLSKFHEDFKEKIVRPLLRYINASFDYLPETHISYEQFIQSGLFARREYELDGNDLVTGKMGHLSFLVCDLMVTWFPQWISKKQPGDVVFYGSFFIMESPRFFSNPIYVVSRSENEGRVFSGGSSDMGFIETWNLGSPVIVSEKSFNEHFEVYARDMVEARQLMNNRLLNRIAALKRDSQTSLYIAFHTNKLYVGINNLQDAFEFSYDYPIDNKQLLGAYFYNFITQLELLQELRESISIWTPNVFSRS